MKQIFLSLLMALALTACNTPSVDTYVDFLYENLSLPDRTDYPRDYYIEQVRLSLQARAEMPWGNSVPEREFRHFVLPPRVSNEDLDTCRSVFFRELKPRLEGFTMQEAILEVNHWCHEHVTYRPTNARTLSPLATLRTAYGRCGEESVFLVAALRSVGIPARQVYTPRWAHTDDNHAWVEAWADGRWWFLGACEPEPVLNVGWFNESASRGMLMHTKVFGNYDGPEEVVSRAHALTEINVTNNYAPTRRLAVLVLDSLDRPVPEATVEFKLYNYAEFYTVARKQTDAEGCASLTAGLGDMLIWVSTPTTFAFQEAHFATDTLVTISLSSPLTRQPFNVSTFQSFNVSTSLNVTPPPVSTSLPIVSPEQRAENDRRLALEDSIRHAYEATMPDQRSRGNHAVIADFRETAPLLGRAALVEPLLSILPDKDLQDITLPVLLDNLLAAPSSLGSRKATSRETTDFQNPPDNQDIMLRYLLSPRIERERLTPYKIPLRKALSQVLPASSTAGQPAISASASPGQPAISDSASPGQPAISDSAADCQPAISASASAGQPAIADVFALIAWTRDSLRIIDDQNPQHLRMQPLGVYRTRTADPLGRDIFFVAACRALNIPARINEINGKVQYYTTTWNTVTFDAPSTSPLASSSSSVATVPEGFPEGSLPPSPSGTLRLTYTPTPHLPDAKYYTHFTLSRLDEQNQLQLLTYPEEATFANTFQNGVTLDAGYYCLITGVRLADGSVRAHLQLFTILPSETTTLPLVLRTTTDAVAVIGSLNAENLYQPLSFRAPADEPSTSPAGAPSSPLSSPSSPAVAPASPLPPTSLLSTCGRGYYVLGLIAPNQEPTNHALRDIALVRQDFERWGRQMVLLFDDAESANRFNFKEFWGLGAAALLPSTVVWGTDLQGTIKQEVVEQLQLPSSSLPIFLICDSFNRVVFIQQGYTIGLGEQLLKVIHQL